MFYVPSVQSVNKIYFQVFAFIYHFNNIIEWISSLFLAEKVENWACEHAEADVCAEAGPSFAVRRILRVVGVLKTIDRLSSYFSISLYDLKPHMFRISRVVERFVRSAHSHQLSEGIEHSSGEIFGAINGGLK